MTRWTLRILALVLVGATDEPSFFHVVLVRVHGGGLSCAGAAMTEADYALLGIDAVNILHAFAWGFSTILVGWVAGYGVSLAVALIRKV